MDPAAERRVGGARFSHPSEHMVHRVDHGRLTLNRVRLWLAFLRGVFLACQLLFDQFVMDSNRTNFGELALPGPRTSRVRRSRAKRRRLKVPLRPSADRPRPAVGTLTRTRNLILAALRVWELKQGIRS